ncbi:hypothetical protein PFNF135_01049 [Plasmodium falciparum NF135/5.C10]|uniref:Uncharacterized protein n=1 Tax=Plasmodium falciparum NF135/5.C10 TaxID=1036726 RepID=W4ILZ1_PLAFA|nr:hypothetical protein PFNF135_01049 [Plasmodium falciparum NF135/5.C10]
MYTNNFYISNILKNFQSSSISLMNMHIKTITLFIILLDNKKMNTYSNIIKYTKSVTSSFFGMMIFSSYMYRHFIF